MGNKNYTRRDFLKVIGAVAGASVLPQIAIGADEKVRKPNIVFILADDLGWHQLGCYGSKYYETPNLDKLAAESMRFTDAYAACPVCSPTRASIMTGKYPARLHLTDFIKGADPKDKKLLTPDWTAYLPAEEETIAEVLKKEGYVTGHFGKWHLNKSYNYQKGMPGDPESQGFDDVLVTQKAGSKEYKEDALNVRQITERAMAFMESNKDKPFFCYVPHNSIHRPETEHPDLIAKYRAKPGADNDEQYGHNNPVQAAMLETFDKGVGDVMKKLDELNLSNNTLLIFFSDNGHLGPKDSKPLRGSKADLYEGGIRVPLLVRWPGMVKPGSVCKEPVISCDFFTTFVEAVGDKVTDPAVDGESMMPLLTQSGKVKRDAIYWHYPHYHGLGIAPSGAIRKGDFKLIEWFEKSIDGIDTEGAFELYNLSSDMNEGHNLAKEMPEKVKELYTDLKKWRKDVGAQEMVLNPAYKGVQTKTE